MGDYLDIIFGASTAAPKAVEWDRCMIIGDGSSSTLSASKLYELGAGNWSNQLENDGFAAGDQLYDSVGIFFAPTPSPERVWCYAYVSGAEVCYNDIPLNYIGGTQWTVPLGPPRKFGSSIERIKFFCCGDDIGTGWTYNYADGSQGVAFTPEKDVGGNWTGKINFPNGLSGTSCGIIKPLTSDCKITADYCMGAEGGIAETIENYRINMVSLALQNSSTLKNYSQSIFGDQLQDIMKMSALISGKNCLWFYALPGDADPDDVIQGTTSTWKELKNLVGARADIAALKAKPSSTNHDIATGYMAMTAISHPHLTLTLAQPHMGIEEFEPTINFNSWKDAQIGCIIQWTELENDPYLISYGFTFGTGDIARVEGTRCRFIIAQTLTNNLKALLAKRTTLMSVEGCKILRATIEATFKILIDQRIADALYAVNIPIEEDFRDNTEAGKIARAQRTFPVVEIEYGFFTTAEKIRITRIQNTAV